MSFSIGIVGLPNVGKSTIFKALTKQAVDASNYPFCTIDPNVGVVKVPDERLYKLAKINNSAQVIHTAIEFVDIAGLVKGAHKGEGLGNKFLANIREVDAVAMVIRSFVDDKVIHVHGKVDPDNDLDIIKLELIFADLEVINKRLTATQKQMKGGGDKLLIKKNKILEQLKTHLEDEKLANTCELEDEEKELISDINLLTLKPFLYIFNVDEKSLHKEIDIKGIDKNQIVKICARVESELADLDDDEKQEFLDELEIKQSGLEKVIEKSYKILNLITFFTSGEKETRAWTVQAGSKAPRAAGKIHTDFEKGFIRAEIISYNDYIECNGELGAKEKGLMRVEGKEYIVKDGDVIFFRFAN